MRFNFIEAHAGIFHIITMCRVLGVSKAGFYAWRARPLCERVKADAVLSARIRAIQEQVKQRYGSPRVRMELRALGFPCGKTRVNRLMKTAGLQAKSARRFRTTTQSDHQQPVAPNVLDRQFAVETVGGPNRVWAADITISRRARAGSISRSFSISARATSWGALRTRLDQELTLTALRMALARRGARGGLHHSDRGVQYVRGAYRQLLADAGFTPSMSRVGNCWDNAVVESFFATVTKELLVDGVFATRDEGCRKVFAFIEIWYNRQRRHSALGYRTPVEFEAALDKVG